LPGLAIQDWGPIQQLYQAVFQAPGLWAAFVLGLLTGFLPCPVTAAVLVAAAATHSVARGMLLMAALGLGTAPVLLGVGLSSGLLTTRFQKIGLKAAGVVLILLGAITVLRGSDVLHRYLGHCPHQSSQTTPIHHDLR
jgi:sulfite exporter TauE/SafE